MNAVCVRLHFLELSDEVLLWIREFWHGLLALRLVLELLKLAKVGQVADDILAALLVGEDLPLLRAEVPKPHLDASKLDRLHVLDTTMMLHGATEALRWQ